MPNTINGVGAPMFTVLETDNTFISDYQFPRCNIRGFEQGHTKDSVVHVLEKDSEIIQTVKGYRYRYIADYSNYLIGDYGLMLRELLNYEIQRKKILLTAHSDSLNVVDQIIFTNAEILLKLLPSGSGQFAAMQGIVIEMLSTKVKPINWIDADQLEIAMDDFAITT